MTQFYSTANTNTLNLIQSQDEKQNFSELPPVTESSTKRRENCYSMLGRENKGKYCRKLRDTRRVTAEMKSAD